MLPVNYQNEIMNSAMSNRRQYRMIENNNNTVSFIDVTVYDQEGSLFDADDVNATNAAINLNITNISAIQEAIASGVVNGIKGSAESSFRVGQVTLTAANLNAYTKTEVDNIIATVGGLSFKLVDSLPTTDISTSTIYLIPSPNSRSRNTKDEYIYIVSCSYTDITEDCVLANSSSAFPSTGQSGKYYIDKSNNNVYTWNTSTNQYDLSSTYTATTVSELPENGSENLLYINSTDNTVSSCTDTSDWEQIGSTAVNLSNYYTKTEIDSGAEITTSEFASFT